ncbi:uncharacterized protein LOC127801497 [Diospyros lotus]|uniref:uncharacterized protein LOC127801497 n=1 Tax=Diospyros lotus TaxID=55363 RepID=UPI00225C0276|nr:uncharacterized protein LOC127801497 [Diospyros lotus]
MSQIRDNILLTVIMFSVDGTITHIVATTKTAKQAWDNLTMTYANKSRIKIYGLHATLANIVKASKLVAECLREIQTIVEELALAGSLLSDDEMVIKILTSLEFEYKEISVVIRARGTPITYEELFDKLVGHETVFKYKANKKEPINITTQYNQCSNKSKGGNYNNNRNNKYFSQNGGQQHTNNQHYCAIEFSSVHLGVFRSLGA